MSQSELPENVAAFLADHIRQLDQFELLIKVIQSDDRWWDAAAAARELGITDAEAHEALDHLAKQNLLDIKITGDVRYQFHPGTDALRQAALACVAEFRRRPVKVLAAIAGSQRRSVRDFADAFRIRRHDDR